MIRKTRKPQDAVVTNVKRLRAEVRLLTKAVKRINKALGFR